MPFCVIFSIHFSILEVPTNRDFSVVPLLYKLPNVVRKFYYFLSQLPVGHSF